MTQTISIALATYNGAKWLPEQLASIAAQTLQPTELIVSDDCSTDGTLDVVRTFADGAAFAVTVIENTERVGFARNFERALAKCSGDIVFLADQDDVWMPHKLAMVAAAMAPGVAVVLHNALFVDEHNVVRAPDMFGRLALLNLAPSWSGKGCCTAVTNDVVRAALPLPDGEPHDNWLHAVGKAIGRLVVLDEPLIRYRIHPGHTSVTRLNQLEPSRLAHFEGVRYRLRKLRRVSKPERKRNHQRAARLADIRATATRR